MYPLWTSQGIGIRSSNPNAILFIPNLDCAPISFPGIIKDKATFRELLSLHNKICFNNSHFINISSEPLLLMKFSPQKLFIGRPHEGEFPTQGSIHKRFSNIKAIWNNVYDNDNGIEKVLRLFLAVSQFFFPGLYIKEIFSKKWIAYQDLAVDVYVLIKVFLPLFIL